MTVIYTLQIHNFLYLLLSTWEPIYVRNLCVKIIWLVVYPAQLAGKNPKIFGGQSTELQVIAVN